MLCKENVKPHDSGREHGERCFCSGCGRDVDVGCTHCVWATRYAAVTSESSLGLCHSWGHEGYGGVINLWYCHQCKGAIACGNRSFPIIATCATVNSRDPRIRHKYGCGHGTCERLYYQRLLSGEQDGSAGDDSLGEDQGGLSASSAHVPTGARHSSQRETGPQGVSDGGGRRGDAGVGGGGSSGDGQSAVALHGRVTRGRQCVAGVRGAGARGNSEPGSSEPQCSVRVRECVNTSGGGDGDRDGYRFGGVDGGRDRSVKRFGVGCVGAQHGFERVTRQRGASSADKQSSGGERGGSAPLDGKAGDVSAAAHDHRGGVHGAPAPVPRRSTASSARESQGRPGARAARAVRVSEGLDLADQRRSVEPVVNTECGECGGSGGNTVRDAQESAGQGGSCDEAVGVAVEFDRKRKMTYNRVYDYHYGVLMCSSSGLKFDAKYVSNVVNMRTRITMAAYKCGCFCCVGGAGWEYDPMVVSWDQYQSRYVNFVKNSVELKMIGNLNACGVYGEMRHLMDVYANVMKMAL